jgi:alkylhydroperoxidase/carboxymuconolactone decarboxylase family protein YurZ
MAGSGSSSPTGPRRNPIAEKVAAMPEDQPVLNALAEITAVSLVHGSLPAREHVLARLAALVAVDAPEASYVMNIQSAVDTEVTIEDVQGLLVAVAPIVGTARVVSASEKITAALGFVIELAVEELEEEVAAELAEAEAEDQA